MIVNLGETRRQGREGGGVASAACDTKRDVQVLLRDAAPTMGVMRLLKAHGVKPDPGIAGQGPDERTEVDSGKAGRDWRDAPRVGGQEETPARSRMAGQRAGGRTLR